MLTLNKEELLRALNPVASVVPPRTPMEQMQNIEIFAEDGLLRIHGCSAEAWVETMTEVSESLAHAILPSALLLSVVESMPDKPIQLSLTDKQLILQSSGTRAKLPAMNPDGFQRASMFEDEVGFKISGPVLCGNLRRVSYAVDRNASSPTLSGLLIRSLPGSVKFVGASTKGITESGATLDTDITADAILPTPSARLVQKYFADAETIEVFVMHDHVTFKTPTLSISSVVIEGKYPAYEAEMKKQLKGDRKITLPVADLLAALKRKSAFLTEDYDFVCLYFGGGELRVVAGIEGKESTDTLAIDYMGDDFHVWLKHPVLVSILERISEGHVVMQHGDEKSAVLFTPKTDTNFWALTMPIKPDRIINPVQK